MIGTRLAHYEITRHLGSGHDRGVIHRDLKPANIKIGPADQVKILDFGLAKAFAGEAAQMNLSNSPTLTMAATNAGVVLGTAAYMSPEQARGKATDRTTDIWAGRTMGSGSLSIDRPIRTT